jgi:signal transduction histidine kinase
MFALKDLARRTETIFKIHCDFHCPIPIFIEDNNLATHLYRIAQEAIHNAVKHGKAEQIDLHLTKEGRQMSLIIQDNGRGFPQDNKNISGIGLYIMKYRARMIDAKLAVKGHPSHGTVLTCSFTLSGEVPEKLETQSKSVSASR